MLHWLEQTVAGKMEIQLQSEIIEIPRDMSVILRLFSSQDLAVKHLKDPS